MNGKCTKKLRSVIANICFNLQKPKFNVLVHFSNDNVVYYYVKLISGEHIGALAMSEPNGNQDSLSFIFQFIS